MTGEFRVPLKTDLPGAEFRYLDAMAHHHGVDVGQLVAEIVHRRLDGVDLDARPPKRVIKKTREPRDPGTPAAPVRRMSDADRVRARELHAEGLTDRDIAAELGWTDSTIGVWRRAAGLPLNRLVKPGQQCGVEGCENDARSVVSDLLVCKIHKQRHDRNGSFEILPRAVENLGKTVWTPELEEQLRALHGEGWSDNRMGKHFGFSVQTVSNRRKRLGLPTLFSGRPPAEVAS